MGDSLIEQEARNRAKEVVAAIPPELAGKIADFLEANETFVNGLVQGFFDVVIEPIDLPGPDMAIDPVLETMLVQGTKLWYSLLVKYLRKKAEGGEA